MIYNEKLCSKSLSHGVGALQKINFPSLLSIINIITKSENARYVQSKNLTVAAERSGWIKAKMQSAQTKNPVPPRDETLNKTRLVLWQTACHYQEKREDDSAKSVQTEYSVFFKSWQKEELVFTYQDIYKVESCEHTDTATYVHQHTHSD